jgi:hypothetical protein
MSLNILKHKLPTDILSLVRKYLITESALILKTALSKTEICLKYVKYSLCDLKPSKLKSEYYCVFKRCNLSMGEQVRLKKRKLERSIYFSRVWYSDLWITNI